jgi:hypothetical protein
MLNFVDPCGSLGDPQYGLTDETSTFQGLQGPLDAAPLAELDERDELHLRAGGSRLDTIDRDPVLKEAASDVVFQALVWGEATHDESAGLLGGLGNALGRVPESACRMQFATGSFDISQNRRCGFASAGTRATKG